MWDKLPIFKTCCCGLPLRTGLALMGIVKMIIVACGMILEIYDYCDSLSDCYYGYYGRKISIVHVELGLYSFLAVIDFIFIILMLTGVYLRHAKLLIISWYYTIVMTAIWILLHGATKIYDMYVTSVMIGVASLRYAIVFEIMELILILMFQFYILLMIKGFIYEVTGVINFKCSTRSSTDYECLIGTDSTDENNVTYSAVPKAYE